MIFQLDWFVFLSAISSYSLIHADLCSLENSLNLKFGIFSVGLVGFGAVKFSASVNLLMQTFIPSSLFFNSTGTVAPYSFRMSLRPFVAHDEKAVRAKGKANL